MRLRCFPIVRLYAIYFFPEVLFLSCGLVAQMYISEVLFVCSSVIRSGIHSFSDVLIL